MKYCKFCGNKIKETSNFCPKCGKNLVQKTSKVIKKDNEEKKEKLLLTIGTILVIVASIIFAFTNWNELTSIFRILFLTIESLLFLSLSIFSKKVDFKTPYKFLWFIGISFIPIILNIIGSDKVLGEYLSYEGSGIYVFLAISFLLLSVIYFVSYKLIKSNIFLYITYIFTYSLLMTIPCLFKLDNFIYMLLIINILNLVLSIVHIFIKNENYKRTLNIFISIILIMTLIPTITYMFNEFNLIFKLITFMTYIGSLFVLLFNSKRNIIIYLYPFIILFVSCFMANAIFTKNINLIVYSSILWFILVNFIMNQKDDKVIKNMSFILTVSFIFITLMIYNVSYITLLIVSLITLALLIFTIKVIPEKVQKSISKLLLPLITLLIIYSIFKNFTKIDTSIIYIVSSVILFTISIIFRYKSKDTFIRNVFEIFAIIYLAMSNLLILFSNVPIYAFILNEIAWIYYFVFNRVVSKNKPLYITLLIALIFNFLVLSLKYSISMYYVLLFIGILLSILDLIELKLKNKTIYIYFSIIFISLIVISNDISVHILGFGLCILAYIFTYYLLNKKHVIPFVIKFMYTLIGFILIYYIFNYFLKNIELINILTFVSYLVVIISMFLLRVDDDRKVLSYSFVTLFPFVEFVTINNFFNNYSTELITSLVIILIFIYFEKVFKLKENDKNIFELVLLIIIHLFTMPYMLIYNFVFATFYIFFGFAKKRDSFILFGTILLAINLIINIYKIANSMPATYILLVIGVLMLGYVFYIEARKRNKK